MIFLGSTGIGTGGSLKYKEIGSGSKLFLGISGIGITFFLMCQMAPSILFQCDISNFNGPFDNLNAPKDRKMRYGI